MKKPYSVERSIYRSEKPPHRRVWSWVVVGPNGDVAECGEWGGGAAKDLCRKLNAAYKAGVTDAKRELRRMTNNAK